MIYGRRIISFLTPINEFISPVLSKEKVKHLEQAGMIVGILGGILGAVGVVASIILGTIAWKRTRKQDIVSDASQDTVLQVDIAYIKRGIDDIKTEQHDMHESFGRLSERVTRVEEAAKSAHKRLDEHIGLLPRDTESRKCEMDCPTNKNS